MRIAALNVNFIRSRLSNLLKDNDPVARGQRALSRAAAEQCKIVVGPKPR
jgi:hypothetical protein